MIDNCKRSFLSVRIVHFVLPVASTIYNNTIKLYRIYECDSKHSDSRQFSSVSLNVTLFCFRYLMKGAKSTCLDHHDKKFLWTWTFYYYALLHLALICFLQSSQNSCLLMVQVILIVYFATYLLRMILLLIASTSRNCANNITGTLRTRKLSLRSTCGM